MHLSGLFMLPACARRIHVAEEFGLVMQEAQAAHRLPQHFSTERQSRYSHLLLGLAFRHYPGRNKKPNCHYPLFVHTDENAFVFQHVC